MSHHSSMRFNDSEGQPVNMVGLSKIIGVTTKVLKEWVMLGMPVVSGGGGRQYVFDTASCIRWKMNQECDAVQKKFEITPHPDVPDEEMTINEAKRRGEVAKTLLAELALVNELEQVANIDDLVGEFADALVNVRASLVSMSSRLSGVLSYQSPDDLGKLLDSEINDVLEHVSKF